jgi:hypothetical protein
MTEKQNKEINRLCKRYKAKILDDTEQSQANQRSIAQHLDWLCDDLISNLQEIHTGKINTNERLNKPHVSYR